MKIAMVVMMMIAVVFMKAMLILKIAMTLAMVLVLINADRDIYCKCSLPQSDHGDSDYGLNGHNEQNGLKCERTGQDNEDGFSYDKSNGGIQNNGDGTVVWTKVMVVLITPQRRCWCWFSLHRAVLQLILFILVRLACLLLTQVVPCR